MGRGRIRPKPRSSFSSDDDDKDSRKMKEINEYLVKKALKVSKKLKTETVSGYANPFGDSNLNQNFVWRKKIECRVAQGLPVDGISIKSWRKMQKEKMAEIEKVKKRREERAIEKAQHEEEMAVLARERAKAEFQDWEKREKEFHFDQSKIRSDIRLREGRVKPIDILFKHLNDADDCGFEVDKLDEPFMVFEGLTVQDMEELHEDINMHLNLDRETPTHREYWEALLVVCDWELAEARKREALDRACVHGKEPPAQLLAGERGLHSSIEGDVENLLHRKTYCELEVLQIDIESQLRSGTAKVVEYWEAIVKRLPIFKAKTCLKEIHSNLLRKDLQFLQNPVKSDDSLKVEHDNPKPQVEEDIAHEVQDVRPYSPKLKLNEERVHEVEEPRSFSPELLHDDENEEAIDPDEDKNELECKRASRVMGDIMEGEVVFGSGAEVNVDSQVYWWHDKYRPRKPKYFNHVHTGYEWNKYNQTHYDHGNPPPKIVQGYTFNIFYPNLIDQSTVPTYTLEIVEDSDGETCLIRFHAGPPYKDIGFKIVNKDWEYSPKKGFKCTFERGILHVYFNFSRYRYRG